MKITLMHGETFDFEDDQSYQIKINVKLSWDNINFYNVFYGKVKAYKVSGCIMIKMEGDNHIIAIFNAYDILDYKKINPDQLDENTLTL